MSTERCVDPRHHVDVWPWHMKGWEAFGCTDREDDPIVRQLGMWDSKGKWVPGTERWGKGESRLGAATIQIILSADDTSAAYVYVDGTTEDGVTKAWHRAAEIMRSGLRELWP